MFPLDACVWGNERRLGQRRWQRGELGQFQREGRYADERGRGRFWLLRLRPHGRRLGRAAHGARRARAGVVGTRERGRGCAAARILPVAPARLHTAQRSERRQHAHPQRQHPQNPSAQRTVGHSEMHDTPTLPRAVGRQVPAARWVDEGARVAELIRLRCCEIRRRERGRPRTEPEKPNATQHPYGVRPAIPYPKCTR
jgi:hypothetical protein